jgi:hypothetical protein
MPLPWKQIIDWAPQIISLSRDLLSRQRVPKSADRLVRPQDATDLAARVAALEENESRQAELVDRMAAQQERLTQAVTLLHGRQRILIGVIAVLVVVLAWKLLRP